MSSMFDVENIREQFPILEREVYGRKLIYLDSAATAQKPRCVVDKMSELLLNENANIHRGVHLLSEEMTAKYEEAREVVRAFIGAECREEVVFTSGATMSLNLVASSYCERNLGEGDNVVVSHIEHHSNIVPWQLAAERKAAELRVIPVDDWVRWSSIRSIVLLTSAPKLWRSRRHRIRSVHAPTCQRLLQRPTRWVQSW